jgi:AraC-like DNA-binding protein
MYRERHTPIPGVLAWSREGGAAEVTRVLPDGCMDLMAIDGVLVVAGPDTSAFLSRSNDIVAIRFAPGLAPRVLGVPAVALRDQRVALADLWPRAEVSAVADAVAHDGLRGLESVAAQRVQPVDPVVPEVLAGVRRGLAVGAIARATGLGERQLNRRCRLAFGYGPRTLARVLRLRRAVARIRDDGALADIAAECGYADQAHLSREIRALAGCTPTALRPAKHAF